MPNLTTWVNKFLQKTAFVENDGNQTVDQQQAEARALLNAASHTATQAELGTKQPLDADLTAWATPADANPLGSETDQLRRRGMIGAAPLLSPTFTGNPASDNTPGIATNSALLATTAFVQNVVAPVAETIEFERIHRIRTAAEGLNDIPSQMIITGTLNNGTNPITVPLVMELNGYAAERPAYTNEGNDLSWDGAQWTLELSGDPGSAIYRSASNVVTPDLAAGWTPDSPATGTPVVTPNTPGGEFTGQITRVGDAAPYTWYSWNGASWDDVTTP
jgi:hypothetical protein